MARAIPYEIKIADAPQVKAALEAAADRIKQLEQECDEWEERYDELLSACGGVWPG